MSNDTFERQLASMYERYRRQHLEDELETLATTMEETLLQQEIAEMFFETTIEIDEDTKSAVERTAEKLQNGEYDAVESKLDDVAERVEQAETHVTNEIHELRIDRQDTATAMRRLNERVDRVDGTQLQALESLLEDWNWKQDIYDDDNETFEERRDAASQFAEDMRFVFETLKDDLFGVYEGTELRPLVTSLLDEERFRLGDLTPEERRQLAESGLADYVELKLS